jgi:succinyl-CoA synthetase alpha subunit
MQQVQISIIFVPPAFAADAIMEAADAGIEVIIMYYRRYSCSMI